MNLNEMIKKLEERKAALVARSEKSEDISELRSINTQLQQINGDIADLRAEQAKADEEKRAAEEAAKKAKEEAEKRAKEEAEKANTNDVDERTAAVNAGENPEEGEKRNAAGGSPAFVPGQGFIASSEGRGVDYTKTLESREDAGQNLKENRAVNCPIGIFTEVRTVEVGDGSTIVVPSYSASDINKDFNMVSSLIDNVAHKSIIGGNSFQQPYVANIAAGGYTAEKQKANTAETTFGYADINSAKITAYGEVTEELMKLPNAPYADEVFQNIRTSMRMTLTKEILIGTGATNRLVGIFSDKATAIDAATDISFATIDDTTLDQIVYSYGGPENVEGSAVLILNKKDLMAFAKVRTSTKERFYDIKSNGNFGTINGIPFIVNSACGHLTGATTAANTYCMAYGNLANYLIVEFSPVEVKRSEHVKFAEGMVAYRGNVMAGGNVVAKNGFLRIKKSATA
ncbi:MAG: phage major capsid protein [Selenomonadaceae bacterium]|nr:phage major capsid protein [Selenomonadaceae bacterium]